MLRCKNPWIAWLVIFTFSFTVVVGTGITTPGPALAMDLEDTIERGSPHNYSQNTSSEPIGAPNNSTDECTDSASPVHIKQGNYFYSHQDLFVPARGPSLQVVRRYDSQDLYDGPFGWGWKFNLEVKLLETTENSGEYVTIRRGNGTRRRFTRNPDGTYSPPGGWKEHLTKNGDGTFTEPVPSLNRRQ